MADEPFDWEKDDARRQLRAGEHWYRQADNTPLMAGQFWALWTGLRAEVDELREDYESLERRLIEERGKQLVREVVSAFWGKVFVVMLAIVTAWIATSWLGHGALPWR